jgi:hypothetical protein
VQSKRRQISEKLYPLATNKISLARLQSSASKVLLLALRSSSRRSGGANVILPIAIDSYSHILLYESRK